MIGVLGNLVFGPRVVNAIKDKIPARFIYPSLHDLGFKKKIEDISVIHYIGSPTVTTHGVLTLLRFRSWRKKIVVSWIGSDGMLATKKKRLELYSRYLQKMVDLNLADSESLVKELSTIGIWARYQPLPVASIYDIRPLPKEKKVAVYLPDDIDYRWNFFRGNIIKKIVKYYPDVHFIIVRNSGKHFNEENVTCIPWTDNMEEIYSQVIATIRLPLHDSAGSTIIETLSMGRNMISSYKFPYCRIAETEEEVKKELQRVLENPTLNVEGSGYIHERYNREKIIEKLVEIYKEVQQGS